MISDEYPLIPPPSIVRINRFHVVVDTFNPGEETERALVTSGVVEPFGATIETRVGTRLGFGLDDDRRAEVSPGI
jgi:hypothetical protein